MIELEIQDELDSWFQIISSHKHYFLLKYMLGRQFPPYLKEKKNLLSFLDLLQRSFFQVLEN